MAALLAKPIPPGVFTLSLHDALPISRLRIHIRSSTARAMTIRRYISSRSSRDKPTLDPNADRKSTRLNSSHRTISYAVFCLKKKPLSRVVSVDVYKLRDSAAHHFLSP